MKAFAKLMILAWGINTAFAIPHLDLEMESYEYREVLQKMKENKMNAPADPVIERALRLGDRLSKWVANINAGRSPETAIRLTSAATRTGVPIDKPNIYNPAIINKKTEDVLSEMPLAMKKIITSNIPFPQLEIDDETFIKHARLLDRLYQSAARFKSLLPYKWQYVERANIDVRGYHYLKSNNIRSSDLRDVSQISAEKIPEIKDALKKLCLNSNITAETCEQNVEESFKENNVAALYDRYFDVGEETWNWFFKIPESRRRVDLNWKKEILTVPFNTPSVPKFIPYLKDNIEDEFRFNNWQLKLNFGIFADGPILVFKPGVVPHVDRLGGNQIVMDSNQPIEEYESQWTIRHEFGHVLGLPDCYHEFYDIKLDAFVNYQLDITDLMCSRAGNMNERIYNELKGAYQ